MDIHCNPKLVATALASEGCRVVMADTQLDKLQRVSQRIVDSTASLGKKDSFGNSATHYNNNVHPLVLKCDITDPRQVVSLISQADEYAAEISSSNSSMSSSTIFPSDGDSSDEDNNDYDEFQPPKSATILVNCAGITRDNWTSKMTMTEWDEVINVNLRGTFLTCRAFLDAQRIESSSAFSQQTRRQNDDGSNSNNNNNTTTTTGSIINISSIVGEYGNLGQANYAASKAGVLGLTKALAKETASRGGIRVNAILPGFIDTPMTQAVPQHVIQDVILPKIPMKRFGKPEDVANLVCFLASCKRSSYITGATIPVSGMLSL